MSALKRWSTLILAISLQEGMTAANYLWKQYGGSVSISRREERQNSGEGRIINLLDAKIKQLEITAQQTLDSDCFNASPTANQLDSVDFQVASTGTVGGINKATYTWWQSTVTTSGSFAAQGLNDMRTLFNAISKGNDTPDLVLTTQSVFEFYEKTLVPQLRFTNTKSLDAGFQNLMFKNATIMWDQYVPSGYLYMLKALGHVRPLGFPKIRIDYRENSVDIQNGQYRAEPAREGVETMYAAREGRYSPSLPGMARGEPKGLSPRFARVTTCNSRYLKWIVDKESDFITTPFIRPQDQDAKTAQLLVMGDVVGYNLAHQGKLTSITA